MRSSTLNWSTVVYYKFGNLTNVHQKDNFFSFIERHKKWNEILLFLKWYTPAGFFSSTIVLKSLAMRPWVHEQQEGALVRYSQIPAVIFSVNSNHGSISVNQYLILLRADRDEEEGCKFGSSQCCRTRFVTISIFELSCRKQQQQSTLSNDCVRNKG